MPIFDIFMSLKLFLQINNLATSDSYLIGWMFLGREKNKKYHAVGLGERQNF